MKSTEASLSTLRNSRPNLRLHLVCGLFEAAMSSVEVNLAEEVHVPQNSTMNVTRKLEYIKMLLWQYENNRAISTAWHYVFLVGYILIGLVALLANGLVVLAMYRNKHVSNILDRHWYVFNCPVLLLYNDD